MEAVTGKILAAAVSGIARPEQFVLCVRGMGLLLYAPTRQALSPEKQAIPAWSL
jgi:hypothetical protein